MAEVIVHKLNKKFDLTHVVKDVDLQIHDKEFVVFRRPVGLRQDHDPAHDRRSRSHHLGDILIDNTVGQRRPADGSRHRHGVPELRALSAHERRRQHGVRPQDAEVREERDRVAHQARRRHPGHRRPAAPQAAPALGRERQRVALDRAHRARSKVFLFDEPLSNLDAKLRVQMRVELKKRTSAGHHGELRDPDQVEAMTLATGSS